MGFIDVKEQVSLPIAPPVGFLRLFTDGTDWRYKDSDDNIYTLDTGLTVQQIKDLIDTTIVAGQGIATTYNGTDLTISQNNIGWMQYSNVSTQTTSIGPSSFTKLIIDNDLFSFGNGLFTKLNTTDIRTDFAGFVQVSFKAEMQVNSNDRPTRAVVVKNDVAIPQTSARNLSKTNLDRYHSVGGTFMVSCAVNDTFSLGYGNAEETSTVSIFAQQATFTVKAAYRNP